jgi:hypothetical protein
MQSNAHAAIETNQIQASHGLVGVHHGMRIKDSAKVHQTRFPSRGWGLGSLVNMDEWVILHCDWSFQIPVVNSHMTLTELRSDWSAQIRKEVILLYKVSYFGSPFKRNCRITNDFL